MTWSVLLPVPDPEEPEPELLDVPVEGGHVRSIVHWQREPSPAVVLLHGLTGSGQSTWVRSITHKLLDQGYHVVRYNARGSDGTERLAEGIAHFGLIEDVDQVLRALNADRRVEGLYVVGFSMGGNKILKLAGSWGAEVPVDLRGIVAVGPATDTPVLGRRIDEERGLRIYRRSFLKDLRRMWQMNHEEFENEVDPEVWKGIRSMRELDDKIVAEAWGFESAEDYYWNVSANRSVAGLQVPTLVLASQDDFLVPIESLDPLKQIPWIRFEETARGGHCAYRARRRVQGVFGQDPDRRWAENRAIEWIRWIEGEGDGRVPA